MKRTIWISSVVAVALILAIGSATARKYKRHHFSKGALLGVETQSVDRELANAFDLPVDYGAIVNDVLRRSPAYEAGIQEDDVIIELDGARIRDSYDLSDLLDEYHEGETVKVVLMRDGEKTELEVELASRSDLFGFVSPRSPVPPRPPKAPQAFWFNQNRPFMGVSLSDLTRQLGEYFGVDKARGALVTEVERNSPAEEAGMKAGDVIIRLDNERVYDFRDVQEIISDSDPGDKLSVVVIREKEEVNLEVTLDERDRYDGSNNSLGSLWLPNLQRQEMIEAEARRAWEHELSRHLKELENVRFHREDAEEIDEAMRELREELRELQDELREELHGLDRRVQ